MMSSELLASYSGWLTTLLRPMFVVGAEVVDGEVDGLDELAGDVDRRGLHLAGRVDELVEHVALAGLGVGVDRAEREDAVERLGELACSTGDEAAPEHAGVAAGEDAAVVAEDAVGAGAAGDPVVAPAADEVVVLGVAVDDVVVGAAVDRVVAGLAVDLVAAADLRRRLRSVAGSIGVEHRASRSAASASRCSRRRPARPKFCGHEVGTADGVVEQVHAADDEALRRRAWP